MITKVICEVKPEVKLVVKPGVKPEVKLKVKPEVKPKVMSKVNRQTQRRHERSLYCLVGARLGNRSFRLRVQLQLLILGRDCMEKDSCNPVSRAGDDSPDNLCYRRCERPVRHKCLENSGCRNNSSAGKYPSI